MIEFSNMAAFAAHLVSLEVAVAKSMQHSLESAARVIETEAKAEIGYYQPEVGGFDAWAQLADSTLVYHAAMGVGDTPLIVTGELYSSISHEVSGMEAVIGSTSDVMVYQELGTDRIPPRAVMGPAGVKSVERIEKILGEGAGRAIAYGSASSFLPLK